MPDPIFPAPIFPASLVVNTFRPRTIGDWPSSNNATRSVPLLVLMKRCVTSHTIEPKTVTDEIRLMADSIAPRRPTTLLGTRPRS